VVTVWSAYNGVRSTESRAISRYLVAKYGKGSTLVPPATDIEDSARFEAAASVEVSNFDKYASACLMSQRCAAVLICHR